MSLKECRTVLGIDPGLSATGFGVLKKGDGSKFTVLGYGVIFTDTSDEIAQRLLYLSGELKGVIKKFRPHFCALETLFFKDGGARSVILSAQCRGAILTVLAKSKIPVFELTPARVKLCVAGSGRASKSQLNYMIKKLLNLQGKLSEHAADALAIAYTGCRLI